MKHPSKGRVEQHPVGATVSFLDAAEMVLRRATRPMNSSEILSRAISAGLIATRGSTPDHTMSAALYRDAKKTTSRFARVAREGRLRGVQGSVRWELKPRARRSQRGG